MAKTLDVVTIGRSSVELHGQQIGARLQDIGSLAKSVKGLPGQHRDRHGAARAEIRGDHPRRRGAAARRRLAAGERVVKAFVIGRTIFGDAARRWPVAAWQKARV